VDLLAGQRGAANAALAAIGEARLWDRTVSGWASRRRLLSLDHPSPNRRVADAVLAGLLVLPLVVVVGTGLVAYLLGFLLDTFGRAQARPSSATTRPGCSEPSLGRGAAVIPAGVIVIAVLGGALAGGDAVGMARPCAGCAWWRVLSAPVDLVESSAL
jgi:hypothetical protein